MSRASLVCAGLIGLGCVAVCQPAHAQQAPDASPSRALDRTIGVGALVAGPLLSVGFGAASVAILAHEPGGPSSAAWASVGAWSLAVQAAAIGMTVYGGFALARSRRADPNRVAFVLAPYAAPGTIGGLVAWRF